MAKQTDNAVNAGAGRDTNTIKTNELRTILANRLASQGWQSVKHFYEQSGVPYSRETLRRAFKPCDGVPIEAATFASIMLHLEYTPNEIKTILSMYADNADIVKLIGDQYGPIYTHAEQALINALRSITKINPTLTYNLADQVDLIGRLAGVDTRPQTDLLRRGA